jgi:hypothetical protein
MKGLPIASSYTAPPRPKSRRGGERRTGAGRRQNLFLCKTEASGRLGT